MAYQEKYEKSADRKKYKNDWQKEHMTSMTGFGLKESGTFRCYKTDTWHDIQPTDFLFLDDLTGFFRVYQYPNHLFPIPKHCLRRKKLNIRNEVFAEAVASGALVKKPGPARWRK